MKGQHKQTDFSKLCHARVCGGQSDSGRESKFSTTRVYSALHTARWLETNV